VELSDAGARQIPLQGKRALYRCPGGELALFFDEVIRLDALVEGESALNDFERRMLGILAGESEPKTINELRWTLVMLDLDRGRCERIASELAGEADFEMNVIGPHSPTAAEMSLANDWTDEEVQAVPNGLSLYEALDNAERAAARAQRRCLKFAEECGEEPWYPEAAEVLWVPIQEEYEGPDGTLRAELSRAFPLTPRGPAPATQEPVRFDVPSFWGDDDSGSIPF
jgi:hypothetical protein